MRNVLGTALADLVELMNLETGWVFLRDPGAQDSRWGSGYVLAAHHNLPPALEVERSEAWEGGCACQGQCDAGQLTEAYNEVYCSRLEQAKGDRQGLTVHASTPLRSGARTLGILNVAGTDWASFSPEALALLTNVGNQMGVALERAQLYDLLQERRIQEQAMLLNMSNQLLTRLDRDDLLAYLVREARGLLGADAAALLLPDQRGECLRFVAASGWRSDPVAAGRCMPPSPEESGSGWVMHSQQPLIVPDLLADDPLPWRPDWIDAEGFRGHAVVPLIAEGRSIGVFVLNMRRPRAPREGEIQFLRLMANQAAMAIEKARLHQEEVRRQQIENEMAVGRQIQLSLLPKGCPTLPGWNCAATYQPANQVGGDFYDFFDLPDGRWGIVVADVSGEGVPAALFMALSRTMVRSTALSGASPAEALIRASELIRKDSRSDLFVTVFYGVLDPHSGKMVYANAGHNRPLVLEAATGAIGELDARGIVLGVLEKVELEEKEVTIAPGDLLVYYTDGITEAVNGEKQIFGRERLRAVVAAQRTAGAQQAVDAILAAVSAFCGDAPKSDDRTLVALKRGG